MLGSPLSSGDFKISLEYKQALIFWIEVDSQRSGPTPPLVAEKIEAKEGRGIESLGSDSGQTGILSLFSFYHLTTAGTSNT